jgi:hypothetical protein
LLCVLISLESAPNIFFGDIITPMPSPSYVKVPTSFEVIKDVDTTFP